MLDPEAMQAAIEFIRSHRRFLVLGHKEPDGDCVASQLTFSRLLKRMDRQALLFSEGPFDRPEIAEFAQFFRRRIVQKDIITGGTAVAILDCSTPDRTGEIGKQVEGLPSLVIDHHSSGEAFGEVKLIDPSAPSVTALVFSLFEVAGYQPDQNEARFILFGICTDTGFFRHLGPGSQEVFTMVARLVQAGTSTAEVYHMIYGKRDLSGRRLLAKLLLRTESYWSGKLLMSYQTLGDSRSLTGNSRGMEELYRLLQTVAGDEVVVLIQEEDRNRYSVGLRSNYDIDVGEIALAFGGGGHRQASGFEIAGTLESVKEKVLAAFEPVFGARTG